MGVAEPAALAEFRRRFYNCCTLRGDALFELTDAVLCADGPVGSLVELSLAAEHRRGHGALYDSLSAGRIDTARLRRSWPAPPPPRHRCAAAAHHLDQRRGHVPQPPPTGRLRREVDIRAVRFALHAPTASLAAPPCLLHQRPGQQQLRIAEPGHQPTPPRQQRPRGQTRQIGLVCIHHTR